MDIERFHNELAMRLGYKRIIKDKRIMISVEECNDPCVTLKVEGHDDFRFKASCGSAIVQEAFPEMREDVVEIMNAVYQAYVDANTKYFDRYGLR